MHALYTSYSVLVQERRSLLATNADKVITGKKTSEEQLEDVSLTLITRMIDKNKQMNKMIIILTCIILVALAFCYIFSNRYYFIHLSGLNIIRCDNITGSCVWFESKNRDARGLAGLSQ